MIKSMADQFEEIIRPRLERAESEASQKVATRIDRQMKENTLAGGAFGADQYDSTYSKSHKRARRKAGVQVEKVDLRYKRRTIENTRVEKTRGRGKGARISFNEGGEIFKMHHDGTAKGNKIRSIWPKTPESVPDSVRTEARQIVGRILRG